MGHHLIDETIEVPLLPQTISEIRAIPTEMCFDCSKCGHMDVEEIDPIDFFQGIVNLPKSILCPSCKKPMQLHYSNFTNCYTIQAIHPVTDIRIDNTKKTEDKIKIIEESRTIRPITTYYVTESNNEITFGVLKAKGKVSIDTKKKPFKFFLIVDELIPEKDYFLNYKITDNDQKDFKKYFTSNKNLDSDISDTIAIHIVGRALAKFFSALMQHSLLYIRNDSLGILSLLLTGDSRCGKSEIILDVVYHLSPLGCEYATAETATRTGISYTLKQVGDSWEIEWGIFPICDKMLVGLDGLHAWKPEEIMQLREVMSQGFIRVRRAVKANSPARVRRLGSLNFQQPVATYPTRWHATWNSKVLGHVDRNRWDFILVFGENDISKAEINKRHRLWKEGKIQRKIPEDVWRKHIIWTWQLTPDRIKIADGTFEKIEMIANEIHEKFSDSKIKPFTNEFFNILERMTFAYAALIHSVDEHDNLVVLPEHAEAIKEKMIEYVHHLELDKVMLSEQFIPPEELDSLLYELKGKNKEKILLFIGNNQGCKQIDIANSLKVDKSYISTELNWFQENQLITGRTDIHLSEVGAALLKKFLDMLAQDNEKVDSTNFSIKEGDVKAKKVESTILSTTNTKNSKNETCRDILVEKKVDSTLLESILEVMNKHPATELHYKEIAKEIGLTSINDVTRVKRCLDTVTEENIDDTAIRRGRADGYYHLIKVIWKNCPEVK